MVRLDFVGEQLVAVDFPSDSSVEDRIEMVRLIQEETAGGELDAGSWRLLEDLVRDRSWRVRCEVAHALRAMNWEDASAFLKPLLNDDAAYVKQAARTSAKHLRKVRRRTGHTQRRVENVASRLEVLERRYDKQAVRSAMQINRCLEDLVVGSIAHDLRNLLTRLRANCHAVTREYGARRPESRKIREDLKFMESTLRCMADYSRPLNGELQAMQLGELIEAAIEQARGSAERKDADVASIAIVNRINTKLILNVVPGPVVTSLANLISNSLEAFSQDCTDKKCQVEIVSSEEQGIVEIRICDNGMGMGDEEFLSHSLFIPGRRNKSKRHSTGFGLANAARCFEALGGAMAIESKLNVGTTVIIQLPSVEH